MVKGMRAMLWSFRKLMMFDVDAAKMDLMRIYGLGGLRATWHVRRGFWDCGMDDEHLGAERSWLFEVDREVGWVLEEEIGE